ncbi:TPA: tRNA pseudouridine(13) synthase TruD, partial [Legionella pneumophila]|nr:tRNA pseudouridine(13) synthase TruD [Legionella pneumophila]
LVKGTALQIINEVYAEWSAWLDGLEKNGLEEAWRANILYAEQIEYRINQGTVELSFVLPAGAYATVVLRELVQY